MQVTEIAAKQLESDIKERRAVQAALAEYAHLAAANEGALLPVLHHIQDHLGYIPPKRVELIAKALNRSRAEVHGVITYYHHFRQAALKGQLVQICRAEACQAVGGNALWQVVCEQHQATHTVEPVYCLGLCANGPAAQVGDALIAHASVDKINHALISAPATREEVVV